MWGTPIIGTHGLRVGEVILVIQITKLGGGIRENLKASILDGIKQTILIRSTYNGGLFEKKGRRALCQVKDFLTLWIVETDTPVSFAISRIEFFSFS